MSPKPQIMWAIKSPKGKLSDFAWRRWISIVQCAPREDYWKDLQKAGFRAVKISIQELH